MRVESLLLVLACLAPALAIRGERRPIRDLRGGDGDKDVFESRGDKAQKEDKEKDEKGEKKDPGNIADKKDKDHKGKKCKKAKKGMKSKKDKGPNQIRRYAEVIPEKEMKFCLHSSDLSQEQCDKVKKGEKLPKDGSVKGGLDIELVHSEEKSSGDILDNVNDILSKDTNPRFVGCQDLDSPPPAKKSNKVRHSRTRRFLEEYETVPEEEDKVDVTGVDFEDLDIVAGGKIQSRVLVVASERRRLQLASNIKNLLGSLQDPDNFSRWNGMRSNSFQCADLLQVARCFVGRRRGRHVQSTGRNHSRAGVSWVVWRTR